MTAIIVGRLSAETTERARHAILRGHARPEIYPEVEAAVARLESTTEPIPRCVFVDACSPGIEGLVQWMRGDARLFSVPVVVIVPSVDDDAFGESHAFGADDVIAAGDDLAIERRVANLAKFDPAARPAITQGRAIVACADLFQRRVLGRILRQAGFGLSFAESTGDLLSVAGGDEPPALIVANEALRDGSALRQVDAVRAAVGAEVPVVVLGPGHALRLLRARARQLGAVIVSNEHAPPDNLLFLANELLRPDVKDIRASTRVLYGTVCGFRPAGRLEQVFGLTYNVSREGFYVRTLDVLPRGTEVWFELRPPGQSRVVHLRGDVVWARGLTQAVGGASPPGFGVRIDEEACPPKDLAAYLSGYEALCEEQTRKDEAVARAS